jgi:hypothetical protein
MYYAGIQTLCLMYTSQNQPPPFEISQERERAPVMMIQPTPLPPGHRVTARGSGWSSTGLRGYASQTQQNARDDGGVSLDSTTIEIPQVTYESKETHSRHPDLQGL